MLLLLLLLNSLQKKKLWMAGFWITQVNQIDAVSEILLEISLKGMLYELFQPKTPFPKLVPEQIHQSKNDRLDLLFTMALTARHRNAVRPKKR